ncbi:MAG: hypothetical protein JJ974_05345 [Phycisphaerales bacterium]|nr:hypothetical protein [Phycisphaerales bacterium]
MTVLALLSTPNAAAQTDQDQYNLTLDQAVAELDSAIQQAGKPDMDEHIRESAAALAFVLDDQEIESADGQLTLGNAYFIAGDLGYAILHYRKGLQIDPSHERLRKNLTHARSFVEPSVPQSFSNSWLNTTLLAWQRVTDRWTMWFFIIGSFALASVLWSIRILDPHNRVPLKASVIAGSVGVIAFGLLSYEQWILNDHRSLVIVTPGTGFYSGPSTSVYQEVYDGSLGIGTEAIVLNERDDGWINVRLSNAQEGWILDGQGVLINQ